MIEVCSTVRVYERNGKEQDYGHEELQIKIRSHLTRREMVVIELPGFDPLTVSSDDLHAAINNATNCVI